MVKLMGMVGMVVGSTVGWYVSQPLVGNVGAFIISTVASGFGMYYGARWARNNFG